MPLLYYWRADNYRNDLDIGAGFHLNQANPLMHSVESGESLWAFTRSRAGQYVLAAELVVKAKTFNPPGFKYGRYRLWGDIHHSRYFAVEGQESIESVVRSLSCSTNAAVLGHSFQGHAAVKAITLQDHYLLQAAAKALPLEPRARILPEDRLEALALLGDRVAVENLVREEQPGISQTRRQYLYREVPVRNPRLADKLQDLYEGHCQICQWHPREQYGVNLCQAHHIQWLSRGGDDRLENLVLVCPNHHVAIHRADAPLDFLNLAFDFGSHKENITMNVHLGSAE